jgi:hypothetical protein
MNPFDSMPQTPRVTKRVVTTTAGNLQYLSAPLFPESPTKRMKHSFTFKTTDTNPLFHAALQRMKEGGALEKLKQQRDDQRAKADELTKRMEALSSGSSHEKVDTTSNTVTLGRNVKRRHSGAALTA